MKRKVLDYRNTENENGDPSAKRQKQPTNSSFSNPSTHKGGLRRKKYYIDITGRTEIWVFPNSVLPDNIKTEIFPNGKEQAFIIENDEKIYLYPPSEIEPTKKIIQSCNKKQKTSYISRDRYYASVSANASIISVHPGDVQSEKLPEKKEQRFIIENNKKIVLYTQSEVDKDRQVSAERRSREIIQSYHKQQNTSSSTTSNVAHPVSSFFSNRLPVVTPKELFDEYNNNNNNNSINVGSRTVPAPTSQHSNILDPTHLQETLHEPNPSVGLTYEEVEYLLFHNVPDRNSLQNADADANANVNANANFNKLNS